MNFGWTGAGRSSSRNGVAPQQGQRVMARTRQADRQQHWQEAMERQKTSGQTIVEFCTKEKLTASENPHGR
jgi:hypothetical protein